MVEMTEIKSLDELMAMLGEKLANSAREWTAKQWQETLQQWTRAMAQDILHHVPDMPRLVSVIASAGGTSTFMTFESDECEFTITINATRKRPPVDAPTFTTERRHPWCGSSKCGLCEQVADTAESDAAQVRVDERRESEPAWPFRKSDGQTAFPASKEA
jgi:hypothetical protein